MHTRETHLKMAKCLKEAKKYLNDEVEVFRKESFVCSAVSLTGSPYETRRAIHKWINKQLGGYAFVTSWAKMNGAKLETFKDYQAYRHAWVDHMIKVLES